MVFGLFSKEKALKRTIDKATNKLSQQPDRFGAMEKLRDDGSDEALYGLFRRFSITSTKSSEDEYEKSWTVDTLVSKGEAVLPALRRYLKASTTIAFALKVLEGVAEKAKVLEIVDELLADEAPGYTRDPEKRIQLIHWLGEWKNGTSADVVSRITPYLADYDENVRFAVADVLEQHPMAEANAPLLAALVREKEESRRVRQRIAELLVDIGGGKAELGANEAAVAPLLAEVLPGFKIDKGCLVRKMK